MTGLVAGSFLQGSFARKTMVSPLNDVDVVLLLPERDRARLHAPGGPSASMEQLKGPLRECFTAVVFDADKRADHALRLDFPDVAFHIDLVPAFEVGNVNGDVDIADRAKACWERSNSRELIRTVSERNQDTGGRFVAQVRMVKTFTTVTPGLDVCGLVGESLAFDAVTEQLDDPQALLRTFERGARLTSGTLTDPTGVDDLLAGWGYERRQATAAVFARAARQAREALRLAAAGDETGAIDLWGSLLGEQFPSPPANADLSKVMRDWHTGGVTSTNRVTPSAAAAAVAARPVRSHLRP